MAFRVSRSLLAAAAILLVLSGCGGGSDGGKSSTDPCVDTKAQAKAAGERINATFGDYNDYTGGSGLGSATTEGRRLGEAARQAMLTWLNLIVNAPDCFTATQVAQAQSLLTNWEQPGTVPAPTVSTGSVP